MYSDNDGLAGSTSRQDSTRSTPGIARRPPGFTSLQLLKQNKEKRARLMQQVEDECDEQSELQIEMVTISSQTDNTMVMLWMRNLISSERRLVPPRRICTCKWHDYIIGRHIYTTFYILLLIPILFLILDVIMSICKKYKRVTQYN